MTLFKPAGKKGETPLVVLKAALAFSSFFLPPGTVTCMIRALKPIVSSVWVCTGSTKESAVLSQARTMAADSAGIRKMQPACNLTKTDGADKVKGKMSSSIYLHACRRVCCTLITKYAKVSLFKGNTKGCVMTRVAFSPQKKKEE